MTIKQQGGVFGRNPSFNDTETNDLIVNDTLGVGAGTPAANAKAHISRASSGASVLSNTTLALESTGDVILDMLSPATGRALIVFGNSTSIQRGDLLYDHNADTLRVRVANATQATFNTSGLAFPNGKGIDFSATAGTGTSELFDDYEEGTWTPAFNTTNGDLVVGSGTINVGLAKYTKIGNRVFLEARFFVGVAFSSVGTGDVIITGLPFASSSSSGANSSVTLGFAYRFATAAPVSGYTTGSEIRLLTDAYTTAVDFTAMPAANLNISGSNKNIIALSVNYEAV